MVSILHKIRRTEKDMTYRTRIEIMSQISRTAKGVGGATRTKMMYKVFLSYAQMKKHLTV
jgi:predicted transcriptional regulator